MYKIPQITIVLTIVIFLGLMSASASDVITGLNEAANQGFIGEESQADIGEGEGIVTSIPGAIGRIIGLVLSFIGLAFFVLMVYGGVIWMFARGNDQDVQKAKDLIQSAIIGLIIVLSAYAVTVFIGNALTGQGTGSTPRG